ncbi:hypothetical protein GCM10010341_33080 [Streptomyces noursei]|nr:hypothetical protein GCM10010341_33080 [Streptomyces noursei]
MASSGTPDQVKGGEMFSPSPLYRRGITVLSSNAVLLSSIPLMRAAIPATAAPAPGPHPKTPARPSPPGPPPAAG